MARSLRQRGWGMKRMYEERLPWSPLKTSVVLSIKPRVPVLGMRSATRLYHPTRGFGAEEGWVSRSHSV